MEKIAAVLVRAAIVYFYLLIVIRVSGKHTLRQATPFDLVVAFILSDLPDDIIWGEVPLAQGLTAIAAIMFTHLLIVLIAVRNPTFDRLVRSVPRPLLEQAATIPHNIAVERISDAELDALLRERQISQRDEVEQGWLEISGQFSVKRTAWAEPARKRDLETLREVLE